MLRWFFTRRAMRELNRPSYRLDNRRYRGVLGVGFLSHLKHSRFFQTIDSAAERRRQFRTRLKFLLLILFVVAFAWVVFESIRALSLF
ncbi:MAG: hypothetical protein LR015_02615 [Verrucomicrobia bacterium]|nr:hypothetical protein [Verrucomicrobiota bacterium]